MRKQINMIVILSVVAIVIIGGLAFMGFGGFGTTVPENKTPADASTGTGDQAAQAILDELQKNGTVVDLRVADIVEGTGEPIVSGDMVQVLYVGMLPDGTVFDASSAHGNQPLSFQVGAGYVIQGWDKGLLGMKEGGKRLLVIPPQLAYGSADHGSIPPNSTLIFQVELLKRAPAGTAE